MFSILPVVVFGRVRARACGVWGECTISGYQYIRRKLASRVVDVRVRVRERERQRGRGVAGEGEREEERVCVRVCEREKRERKREKERERESVCVREYVYKSIYTCTTFSVSLAF